MPVTTNLSTLVTTPELFVLPHQDRFLLFAPLKGIVLLVTSGVVHWLARYQANPAAVSDSPLVTELARAGVLEPTGSTPLPAPAADEMFQPTDLILLTTTACNFRCVYCYASAGTRQMNFRPEVARSAIRLVVGNAIRLGKSACNISFHGGGEPTTAWSFLRKCLDYAEGLAQGQIRLQPGIVTNGFLNRHQCAWLAAHMHSIQVSLDGPADIHNEQRPLWNGGPSFERVRETVRNFEESGVPHVLVKATITRQHIGDLPRIAQFFCDTFATKRFHFGAVMESGRSIHSGYGQPATADFLEAVWKAQEIARGCGKEIVVSLAQNTFPNVRTAFCGLSQPNFAVSVEGAVTACYEVLYADDPRASLFHYGYYDPDNDDFRFDGQRIQSLRQLRLPTLDRCEHCFAKWQCAGDCQMRLYDENTGEPMESLHDFRCEVNRALVRRQLVEVIEQQGPFVRLAPSLATDHGLR